MVLRFFFFVFSLEDDVFIFIVREVQCLEVNIDIVFCKESLGFWGVSILKVGVGVFGEQFVDFNLFLEVFLILKVRVYIQGVQVES